MKLFAIAFVCLVYSVYGQNSNIKTGDSFKSFNEISYQVPLALGFSHIKNFNDKLLIGAGIHAGPCVYLGYIDLLNIKLFTRNVFNHNKIGNKIDYDLGVFFSYPYFELEIDAGYGLITSIFYNFWKLKIGGEFLTGFFKENKNHDFRAILFTPILIIEI